MERANARHVKNLDELKDLIVSGTNELAAAGKDTSNAKVLGTKNGSLYVSVKAPSLWSRFTGARAKQRENGRLAVTKLIGAAAGPLKKPTAGKDLGIAPTKSVIVFEDLHKIARGNRAVKASEVYKYATFVRTQVSFGDEQVKEFSRDDVPPDLLSASGHVEVITPELENLLDKLDEVTKASKDAPSRARPLSVPDVDARVSGGKNNIADPLRNSASARGWFEESSETEDKLIDELESAKPVDVALRNGFMRIGQEIAAGDILEGEVDNLKEVVKALVGHPDLDRLTDPVKFKSTISAYFTAGLDENKAGAVKRFLQDHNVLDDAFAARQKQRIDETAFVARPSPTMSAERVLVESSDEEELAPVRAPSKNQGDDASLGKLKSDMQRVGEAVAGGAYKADAIVNDIAAAFFARAKADPAEGGKLASGKYFKEQALSLMKEGLPENQPEFVDLYLKEEDLPGKAFEQFQEMTNKQAQWRRAPAPSPESPRSASARPPTFARARVEQVERADRRRLESRGNRDASKLANAASSIAPLLTRGDGSLRSKKELAEHQQTLADVFISEAKLNPDGGYVKALTGRSDFMAQTRPGLSEYVSEPQLTEFLEGSFRLAANALLGSRELASTTTITLEDRKTEKTMNDVEFKIGDQVVVYVLEKHLGTGGFGDVFQFKARDDNEKKIALKFAIDAEDPKVQTMFADDALMHRAIAGDGHPNLVGYKGALYSPTLGYCIAAEVASEGTAEENAEIIRKAFADGTIEESERDTVLLTAAKDVAEGLEDLNKRAMHHDIKPVNIWFSPNGQAQLGDFGTSRLGRRISYRSTARVDNPFYQSPERLYASYESKDFKRKEINPGLKQARFEERGRLERTFPDLKGKHMQDALENVMSPRNRKAKERVKDFKAQMSVDTAADVWAWGITIAEMFNAGKKPVTNSFAEWGNKVIGLGGDAKNAAVAERDEHGALPNGAIVESTGHPALDALLNATLRPLPEDRLSAAEIAAHPLLNTPKVGSQQARDLLIALRSGDPKKITDAKDALAQVN